MLHWTYVYAECNQSHFHVCMNQLDGKDRFVDGVGGGGEVIRQYSLKFIKNTLKHQDCVSHLMIISM